MSAGSAAKESILSSEDDTRREKAAGTIQRNYRGHRTRNQLRGFSLDPSTRWIEAVKDARFQQLTTPVAPIIPTEGKESSYEGKAENPVPTSPGGRRNWIRATRIAQRAGADDQAQSGSELSSRLSDEGDAVPDASLTAEQREKRRVRREEAKRVRKEHAKTMSLDYWLELVDQKHRYGSNLRKYHAYWQTQDTDQNFFYWLDHGDGRIVDLEERSRARLDKEQVRYLSREERQYYRVLVNKEGLLVWAKNGELVWTKDELYKDSMKGIVPVDDQTPQYVANVHSGRQKSDSGSKESGSDGNDEHNEIDGHKEGDEGERYVNEDFHRAKGPTKLKHVSAGALFNHMMRDSMKKGRKWIFVADTSFRLYVGYKQSGAFQHSSFLHGSRIAAAGLVKVKRGQLRSLAPLSGHYRPPADSFRNFVHSLRDEGVDMSRVSISKSYAVIVGMESYLKTRERIKRAESAVARQTELLVNPEKAARDAEARRDKSQSAEKERLHLEKLRREQQQQQHGSHQGARQDGFGAHVSKVLDETDEPGREEGRCCESCWHAYSGHWAGGRCAASGRERVSTSSPAFADSGENRSRFKLFTHDQEDA